MSIDIAYETYEFHPGDEDLTLANIRQAMATTPTMWDQSVARAHKHYGAHAQRRVERAEASQKEARARYAAAMFCLTHGSQRLDEYHAELDHAFGGMADSFPSLTLVVDEVQDTGNDVVHFRHVIRNGVHRKYVGKVIYGGPPVRPY